MPRHTLVYELEGPIFFATVDELLRITAQKNTRVIILRMRSVPSMDIAALTSLDGFVDRCKARNITVLLSHVQSQPYSVMRKAGFDKKLGQENFCANIDAALAKAEAMLPVKKAKED